MEGFEERPKKLPDHVETYFMSKDSPKEVILSKMLFEAENDLELKSEMMLHPEISIVRNLDVMHAFLESKIPGISSFDKVVIGHMRKRISTDGHSRNQVVEINNHGENLNNNLQKISNFKNIMDSKA